MISRCKFIPLPGRISPDKTFHRNQIISISACRKRPVFHIISYRLSPSPRLLIVVSLSLKGMEKRDGEVLCVAARSARITADYVDKIARRISKARARHTGCFKMCARFISNKNINKNVNKNINKNLELKNLPTSCFFNSIKL